jgi:hypothetical protein
MFQECSLIGLLLGLEVSLHMGRIFGRIRVLDSNTFDWPTCHYRLFHVSVDKRTDFIVNTIAVFLALQTNAVITFAMFCCGQIMLYCLLLDCPQRHILCTGSWRNTIRYNTIQYNTVSCCKLLREAFKGFLCFCDEKGIRNLAIVLTCQPDLCLKRLRKTTTSAAILGHQSYMFSKY